MLTRALPARHGRIGVERAASRGAARRRRRLRLARRAGLALLPAVACGDPAGPDTGGPDPVEPAAVALVFDMVVDGNRDIYAATLIFAVDSAGGATGAGVTVDGLERLTTDPAADHDPTIAADGAVVFVSERDGNAELYALRPSAGTPVRLTATPEPERQPALSADGTRLAFARGAGLTRVYIAAPDASGAERPDPAHGHGGTLENAPAWSPDGRALAFVSTAHGNPDLFLWSGGAASWLEGGDGGEFEPAWSPDAARIAFASSRDGDAELYLLDQDGGAPTRLTERDGSDGHPVWTPAGRIIYVAYEGATRTLRWLDPDAPGTTHAIPLPGEPGNPAVLLP